MKLSDKWFTALSENEKGDLITIYGREELEEFVTSGKFKERIEVTWKYTPDAKGLPSDNEAELMENVEIALRKVMEKRQVGHTQQRIHWRRRTNLGVLHSDFPGIRRKVE